MPGTSSAYLFHLIWHAGCQSLLREGCYRRSIHRGFETSSIYHLSISAYEAVQGRLYVPPTHTESNNKYLHRKAGAREAKQIHSERIFRPTQISLKRACGVPIRQHHISLISTTKNAEYFCGYKKCMHIDTRKVNTLWILRVISKRKNPSSPRKETLNKNLGSRHRQRW
jgi:hypothetical protein